MHINQARCPYQMTAAAAAAAAAYFLVLAVGIYKYYHLMKLAQITRRSTIYPISLADWPSSSTLLQLFVAVMNPTGILIHTWLEGVREIVQ